MKIVTQTHNMEKVYISIPRKITLIALTEELV